MKVLIIGSGGREHAIATSVAKSSRVDKIYCAPGNAGIEEFAECVPIQAMEFDKLVAFAKEQAIDLTVVGMDDPLVGGIVDAFEAEGLRVFGPRKNAAILEGSKAFSKDLMKKYNIPADHVIRHYDVTGKICPNPYVYNTGTYTWDAFKTSHFWAEWRYSPSNHQAVVPCPQDLEERPQPDRGVSDAEKGTAVCRSARRISCVQLSLIHI